MKRLLAALLLLALLCGCAAPAAAPSDTPDGRLRVIATIFPQYDFVRQLAGDLVQVRMLAAPGSEVHDFVPSLSDMQAFADADLLICVGGESERWVDQLLDSLGADAPMTLSLCEMVQTVDEALVEGMEGEAEEAEPDEHVWTSPKNAITICEGIAAALAELDPANAAAYTANLAAYRAELEALDADMHRAVDEGDLHTLVFAERFPFRYLAEELELDYYAAFPGCSSDTEPSLATISFLSDIVREQGLPVVFFVEFSTETVADTICSATGAQKRLLHSCHNVSQEDFDAGVTYLDLMRQNAANLAYALRSR